MAKEVKLYLLFIVQ
uniref:Uncharacterized protein n=1 Tax=Arundo donax TaxID=35708 RepID=A0A0A9FFL6_ARUDO